MSVHHRTEDSATVTFVCAASVEGTDLGTLSLKMVF